MWNELKFTLRKVNIIVHLREKKNLTLDLKTVKNSIQAFIVCLFVIYLFSFFISCFLFFNFSLPSALYPCYPHVRTLVNFQFIFYFLQNAVLLAIFTLGVCRSAVLKSTRHSTTSIDPVVAWRLADVFSARPRRSLLTVNPKISNIAAGEPSFQMAVRLFGKTQRFLQITADGTVNGTSRCTSKYGKRGTRFLQF